MVKLSLHEQTLLEGCRLGNERSWLSLYKTYSSDIGFFLKGMLQHSSDIDDLLQNVFLEFLKSIKNFRGESSLRTWLYRIARHVALREIHKNKRRQEIESQYIDQASDQIGNSVEDQIITQDHLHYVNTMLSTLDVSFREVWILRELKGYSVIETAEILEIKEATVRTRHFRARSQLLKLLKNQTESVQPSKKSLVSSSPSSSTTSLPSSSIIKSTPSQNNHVSTTDIEEAQYALTQSTSKSWANGRR
jgi:RNA polymerase sigma-70 factor, ECF subfamily